MDPSLMSVAELERELLLPNLFGEGELRVTDRPGHPVPAGESRDLLSYKLRVARELLLRDLHARMQLSPVLNAPDIVRDWLRLYCRGLEHEMFAVLYLNAQQVLIEAVRHFNGTLTQTSVYPREIVKGALLRNAAAVIVFHNHPSGNVEPSRADEFLTQAIKSALALVDVRVLDHFVVAGDQVLSFAERGLL